MEPVYLRALEVEDLERTHKWHNDPSLYKTLGSNFRFVSRSAEEAWLKQKCAFSKNEVNLAICLKDTNDHIGNIYLRDIDWISRRGTNHIFIGDTENRGKGYGQSAIRQLISYAFDELNLQKISLIIFADNDVARHIYKKCGFTVEGTLKRHFYKNGQFKDVICMGLCRELKS